VGFFTLNEVDGMPYIDIVYIGVFTRYFVDNRIGIIFIGN